MAFLRTGDVMGKETMSKIVVPVLATLLVVPQQNDGLNTHEVHQHPYFWMQYELQPLDVQAN